MNTLEDKFLNNTSLPLVTRLGLRTYPFPFPDPLAVVRASNKIEASADLCYAIALQGISLIEYHANRQVESGYIETLAIGAAAGTILGSAYLLVREKYFPASCKIRDATARLDNTVMLLSSARDGAAAALAGKIVASLSTYLPFMQDSF